MKILLLQPSLPSSIVWGNFRKAQGFLPPIGLISLCRYLEQKGYDVTFKDFQFDDTSEDAFLAEMPQEEYTLIGIPVYTPTAEYSFRAARIYKSIFPKTKIVFGGAHVSIMPKETMKECKECDFIVQNEGEVTLLDLVGTIENNGDFSKVPGLVWRNSSQIIINPMRPFIENLDILPSGVYGELDISKYIPHPTQYVALPNYPLITQRGCPYSCAFCCAPVILGKKIRRYSISRIIEELKILKYQKKAQGVYFQDSTFTINRGHTLDLMDKIIQAKLGLLWSCNTRADKVDPVLLAQMRNAGCRQIVFGIESGNQKSLDILRKGVTVNQQTKGVKWTQEAGILVINNFILCIPGETEDMVSNTIFYAKKLAAQISLFYFPFPYPETELYRLCKESGGLPEDIHWSDYSMFKDEHPVFINPLIGLKRMQNLYRKAFWDYYSSPKIWWQNLRTIRSIIDVKRFFRGAKALSGFLKNS